MMLASKLCTFYCYRSQINITIVVGFLCKVSLFSWRGLLDLASFTIC